MSTLTDAISEATTTAVKNVAVTGLTTVLTAVCAALTGDELKNFIEDLLDRAEIEAAKTSNKLDDFAIGILATSVRKVSSISDSDRDVVVDDEKSTETSAV